MKIEIFKGKNSFEIGKLFGKAYKKNRAHFDGAHIDQKIYSQQLKIYQKYFPSFLEELRGVAEVGGYDCEKLTYSFIGAPIAFMKTQKRYLEPACSVFGFSKDENLFVGRNYDWMPVTEKIFKIYTTAHQEKYTFISISDMHIFGKWVSVADQRYVPIDTINEKGLYIGLTASINNDWDFGLSDVHIIKLIAESCKNVEEAIKIFTTVPLNCAKNFFVADAHGDMAVIEHFSGLTMKIVKPTDNLLIKTNHYTDPEFARKDKVLKYKPTITTFLRYYEIMKEVNSCRKTFTQKDIVKILNNKDSYLMQDSATTRSIWTLSLDMTQRKYKLYYDLFGEKKSIVLRI